MISIFDLGIKILFITILIVLILIGSIKKK